MSSYIPLEEFQVNTYTQDTQGWPAISALADGGYVITWMSSGQDGDNNGIFGQRYSADGSLNGGEFQINTFTQGRQGNPDVTALRNGGFVVTWESDEQDGENYGIYGKIYNADGSANGAEFQVNVLTDGYQREPSTTSLADGGFIITWRHSNQGDDNNGLYGQRYNADGSTYGDEFNIEDGGGNSVVTGLSDGGFVVAWDGPGINGQRYNADGSLNGNKFQINSTTDGNQINPSITALVDDSFVVTWDSSDGSHYGVYGQTFNADGSANGEGFRVNTTRYGPQHEPDITALPDGGFVVTWMSDQGGSDHEYNIYGQLYNADGNPDGIEFLINSFTDSYQASPSITTLNDGSFTVTWFGYEQDGSSAGVFAKTFQRVPELLEVTEDDFISYTNQDVIVESFEIIDKTEIHIAGNTWKAVDFEYTVTEDSYVTFDYKTVIEGEIHGLIFLEDGLDPNASGTVHQGLDLIRTDGFQSYGSPALYTEATDTFQTITVKLSDYYDVGTDISHLVFVNDDDANAAGESVFKDIKVFEAEPVIEYGPPGPQLKGSEEFLVNTFKDDYQGQPKITSLTDDGFVITWVSSNQDGNRSGVYGQRYDAHGDTFGGEFKINTSTDVDFIELPNITALSDGGFIATWQANPYDFSQGFGVFAQRYNADGTRNGNEFQINTSSSADHELPDIAGLSDGGFVATWHRYEFPDGGEGNGVFGRFYNADGTAKGEEFRINDSDFESNFADPVPISVITALSDGGFVVTWTNELNGNVYGTAVYGKRYDADGNATGSEFVVNSYAGTSQEYPDITALSDGGFVVTWNSALQDLSGRGVFGQRFNADGSKSGYEFQINTMTEGNQDSSAVTALNDGGFVVVWGHNNNYGDDTGLYAQRFNADGTKNGTEFIFSDAILNYLSEPDVIGLSDGGFAVTWTEYTGEESSFDIYAKIFRPVSEFLEFAEDDFISYTNQDVIVENFEVIDNTEVHIAGNTWKAVDFEYTVTENSLVTFDYKTVIEGEIHGLIFLEDGLDPNASGIVHQGLDLIRMDGFQSYGGPSALYTEAADTFQTITVNLSDYYDVDTDISHLVFVNDDDANAAGDSVYKNIKVYEENGIYGDAADNILSGTSEADYLYGDAGADTFLFDASSFDAVDVIGDFDIAEGDALDISDVLIGYDAITDAISDFVQITDNGADSILSVDINGGADNFVPIAILSNATGLSDEDALETAGNLITV